MLSSYDHDHYLVGIFQFTDMSVESYELPHGLYALCGIFNPFTAKQFVLSANQITVTGS